MRAVLLLVTLMATQVMMAHDFKEDGIYYKYVSDNVYVTYRGEQFNSYTGEYSGEIVIPETVTHNNVTYKVTGIYQSAFSQCEELTKVTIGNSIKEIQLNAFSGCTGLTEVYFGNSLETIDYEAFCGCESLMAVELPNSVTTLGYGVFSLCHNLKSVKLSTSLTRIPETTFWACTSLKSINLHEGITFIGRHAFGNCKGLTSVTIPESVTVMKSDAFYNCTSLTTLNWNPIHCNGSDGYYADPIDGLPECIEVVNFGEHVQSIPYGFLSGSRVKSVVIPNSVTHLGYDAFNDCQYLEHITIGESLKVSSDDFFFAGCGNIKSLTWNAINPGGYFYIYGRNNIEQFSIGEHVERVPDGIINGSKIQSVTIPSSVTTVDDGAFMACSNLTSIVVEQGNAVLDSRNNCNAVINSNSNTLIVGCKNSFIPNTVRAIGNYAFIGCDLTNINIPNSVVSIGTNDIEHYRIVPGAFGGCSGLTSINLPNSVEIIGLNAFSGCNISSLTLSESLKEIGDNAFRFCKSLMAVELPESLRSIGNGAFAHSGLKGISIPDSVVIGNEAFFDTPIESVSVASTDMLMGYDIFNGTPWENNQSESEPISLGSSIYLYNGGLFPAGSVLSIPDGVTGIAGGAFGNNRDADEYLTGIVKIEIPNSVRYIGYNTFRRCPDLESLSLGNGIEVIGKSAFADAEKLTELIIPNSVKEIQESAFKYCESLTDLTIGSGIKYLENDVFSGCYSLTKVTCLSTVPPVIKDAKNHESQECFDEEVYTNAVLFVPRGLEATYMLADKWKKFIHIVGITVSTGASDVNGDGEVNIADINNMVDAILSGDKDKTFDVNGDGEIGIADINEIVQTILGSN